MPETLEYINHTNLAASDHLAITHPQQRETSDQKENWTHRQKLRLTFEEKRLDLVVPHV